MKNDVSDLNRLNHIIGAISDLETILNGVDEEAFYRSAEKRYATERILEIIG